MVFIAIEPVEPMIEPVSQSPHRFIRQSSFLNYLPRWLPEVRGPKKIPTTAALQIPR
jgi:hypothetical protein